MNLGIGLGISKRRRRKLKTYFARFFTTASSWVGGLLKSSVGSLTLVPVGRGCLSTTGTEELHPDDYVLNNQTKWAFQIELGSFDINATSFMFLLGHESENSRISLKNSGVKNVHTYSSSNVGRDFANYDSSNLQPGDVLTIVADGSDTCMFVHDTLVDSLGISIKLRINRLLNYKAPEYGLGYIGQANDIKIWHLDTHTGAFTPEGLPTLPTYWLPLDNFKAGSTPSVVAFPCIITGIEATLVNGAPATNLSSRTDANRSNNLLGFSKGQNYLMYGNVFPSWMSYTLNFTENQPFYNGENIATLIESISAEASNIDINHTFDSATNYTLSIYAKKAASKFLTLRAVFFDTNFQIGFDLEAGTCQSGGIIDNVGNGWYRCSVTSSINGADTSGRFYIYPSASLGGGTSAVGNSLYIANAQVSLTSQPIDYIDTNGYIQDKNEYTPMLQDGSGLDVKGRILTNPAINDGKGYNGCEQRYQCPDIPKEHDTANFWKSADGTVINTVNVADHPDAVLTENGSVSDLPIK